VKYAPQLATLVTTPPAGNEWLHEIKYDGYRIGCRVECGEVSLVSRSGKDWTSRFGEIATAASRLPATRALIDGEVVVMLPDGRSSFQALQHALSGTAPRSGLVYVAFDLLWLDGEPLGSLPLETRKIRLRALLGKAPPEGRIRFADHMVGNGPAFFEAAERLGLEGIVSKRRTGPHRPGRTGEWTKTKCAQRQHFVIGGFTDQVGNPGVLGALLLGQFQDDTLIYTGNVGTGYSQDEADQLRRTLVSLKRPAAPFANPPSGSAARRPTWVEPIVVCAVSFVEWTADGRVRQPSYQGVQPSIEASGVRSSR
jgi:bifunctional non-homologous end joining protein LigD